MQTGRDQGFVNGAPDSEKFVTMNMRSPPPWVRREKMRWTMEDPLVKLNADQLAALNEEQKAIFCALSPADQDFFASAFKPAELAGALMRKREIMQRNQAERERLARMMEALRKGAEAHPPDEDAAEDALAAAALGALGLGAAAVIATDNTAFYHGVQPEALIPPLRAEFEGKATTITFGGQTGALMATVAILSESEAVPALTIHLTAVNDGVEVKVNDLTTRGVLETVKEGGKRLLDVAGKGLDLLSGRARSPLDLADKAGRVLSSGISLAEAASNLNLKQRAWRSIKQAAEAIEKKYLSELDEARQLRYALEKAWDNFNNCPGCGVSFGPEDAVCRVCGTARPLRPTAPDPRLP